MFTIVRSVTPPEDVRHKIKRDETLRLQAEHDRFAKRIETASYREKLDRLLKKYGGRYAKKQ